MCRNRQGLLVPLTPKVRKCGDEILEGSSFDPVRSAVNVARSAEVDCTGLGLFDTLFQYR